MGLLNFSFLGGFQEKLGDVVFVELPEVDSEVTKEGVCENNACICRSGFQCFWIISVARCVLCAGECEGSSGRSLPTLRDGDRGQHGAV